MKFKNLLLVTGVVMLFAVFTACSQSSGEASVDNTEMSVEKGDAEKKCCASKSNDAKCSKTKCGEGKCGEGKCGNAKCAEAKASADSAGTCTKSEVAADSVSKSEV